MRALVLLPDDLAAVRVAGRSLADHWAFLGARAGVPVEVVRPEAVVPGSPLLVVDGRCAALSTGSLAAIAAHADACSLLSSSGEVVAAIVTGVSEAPLAARMRAVGSVEAVVGPSEGLRVDESPGEVEAVVRRAWLDGLVGMGVRVVDAARTIVDTTVEIEANALIWPDAVLRGATRIAAGAEIQQGAWLEDTSVGQGALVRPYTVCSGAWVGPAAQVGPFAHLRPGAVLEADTRVGNFVEVKATTLRQGAKASHLTYLGDAEIGAGANIGAGTITCNYDGFGKYRTTVGAGAFVGSNSSLVAPVTVGEGAIVGAGSVVTSDVPADALYVERAVPKLVEGQAPRLRARNRKRAETRE